MRFDLIVIDYMRFLAFFDFLNSTRVLRALIVIVYGLRSAISEHFQGTHVLIMFTCGLCLVSSRLYFSFRIRVQVSR